MNSLGARMAAPVVVLGGVALAVQAWPWSQADTPSQVTLVTLAGLGISVLTAVAMGRRIARRLGLLPQQMRDIVWGEAGDPIPGAGPGDIGTLVSDLDALAREMCAVIESRAEMEKLALTDALTGLPNRRGLFEFFSVIERTAPRDGSQRIGVMHVDLDHFKAVNDRLGHDAGDFVLKDATRRISSAIRDSDVLARLGGDEFVVIAPGVESEKTMERIAGRIIEQFETPIFYRDTPCSVSASIGMVLGGQRGKVLDPARLLINADIALCHAKEGGRNQAALFNSTMAREIQQRKTEADEIRRGLLNDDFQPWFAPTVDTRTGQLAGIDVLLRWNNPGRGLLSPHAFLDTVEAYNMLEELGMQVFERACASIVEWRAAGIDLPTMHFGMSRAQLLAPAVVDKVSWLLDDSGIEPQAVQIGISERHCNGRSVELIFANLKRFAALGIDLVLDDFGSDNGSISNIVRLGARQVRAAEGVMAEQDLLHSLMGIGDRLDLPIVMKNVRDQAQVPHLQSIGLSLMQGPAIAAEMNAAEMTAWLTAQRTPATAHAAKA